MQDETTTEETISETVSDTENDTQEETNDAPSQDPVEKELARVKKPKTEKEKAEAALFFNANRLRELGGDPDAILSSKKETSEEDTSGNEIPDWYKKELARTAQKSAKELAEAIEDHKERDLVLHHLEHTITSGSPEERVRIARGYVNSVRNSQIAEETARGGQTRTHNSAPGVPSKSDIAAITDLTDDEKAALSFRGMDGKPLLTEDDIRKARQAAAAQ